ncbi:MAG: restriction endonuclease subunit M, partial [Prevotellaceae bacterium]|nr:restriction endonuclease subunit M [Prevotellaceae bacterium]
LKFGLSLFERGRNSIGFGQTSKDENEIYANMISDELNDFLQHSIHRVNVAIYDVQPDNPLNLVTLSFGIQKKNVTFKSARDLANTLKILNNYALQQKKLSLHVLKQFRYYDNNLVYLVKPNQKRFWTRSQAMDDAMALTVEISNMKTTQKE